MNVVGYMDVVDGNSLIAGCSPSYSSISLAHVDDSGKITPLDIATSEYESSINSICFNNSSNFLFVSTMDCKNYVWDVTMHSNVSNYVTEGSLSGLQRYINENTWIGKENNHLLMIDLRDQHVHRVHEFSEITSFSLSSDKRYIFMSLLT